MSCFARRSCCEARKRAEQTQWLSAWSCNFSKARVAMAEGLHSGTWKICLTPWPFIRQGSPIHDRDWAMRFPISAWSNDSNHAMMGSTGFTPAPDHL